VLPESYPFVCLDSFLKFDLKTLPARSREQVALVRFLSLQRFGFTKVFLFGTCLIPNAGRFYGLVTILTIYLIVKPWDLFSYPNVLKISPLEFFPF